MGLTEFMRHNPPKFQIIELISEQLEEEMLLILSVLFCFKAFDVYIKIPMKRDIFLNYNYEMMVYIYMLRR